MIKGQQFRKLGRRKDGQVPSVVRGLGGAVGAGNVDGGNGVLPGVAVRVRIRMKLSQEGYGEAGSRRAAVSRDSP